MTTIFWTLFQSLSAPFFPALPGRYRKVLGQKSPILRAPHERPKNFCENWTTVYLGRKVIVDVHTIGRKIDVILIKGLQMPRKCAKLAKYGVFVKRFVALGFHPVALSVWPASRVYYSSKLAPVGRHNKLT